MSTLSVDTVQGQTAAGNVKMPAGYVVQEVHHPCTTYFILNTTSYTDLTGASITFTPKFNNSKLLVQSVQHFYLEQTGAAWSGANSRIVIDGNGQAASSSSGSSVYGVGSRDTNQAGGQTTRLMAYDNQTATYTVSSTNSIVIKAQVKLVQSITTCNVNNYGRGYLKVTEIAQ